MGQKASRRRLVIARQRMWHIGRVQTASRMKETSCPLDDLISLLAYKTILRNGVDHSLRVGMTGLPQYAQTVVALSVSSLISAFA